MRKLIPALTLSVATILAACTTTGSEPTGESREVATVSDKSHLVTESRQFRVHADPWMSLHHMAFHYARNGSGMKLRGYTPLTQDDLDAFTPEVVAAFAPLAEAYEPYFEMSLVRSAPLRFVAVALYDGGIDAVEDEALKQALMVFMPVYKAHFWDRHKSASLSLIDSFSDQLDDHADAMADRLADYLDSEWSSEPMRVDIVPYASWAGAYTGTRPKNHLTIGAMQDMALNNSFETLFHEAAHGKPMSNNLRPAEAAAMEASGLDMDRFWHALLWYASGRASQDVLGDDYQPIYVTSGRLTDDTWGPVYQAFEAVWDQHDTLEERAIAAAIMARKMRKELIRSGDGRSE